MATITKWSSSDTGLRWLAFIGALLIAAKELIAWATP